jgi:hypothetical protein
MMKEMIRKREEEEERLRLEAEAEAAEAARLEAEALEAEEREKRLAAEEAARLQREAAEAAARANMVVERVPTPPPPPPPNAAELRLQMFFDRLQDSSTLHSQHPRRDHHRFFLPMTFAEDISFNPFESLSAVDIEHHGDTAPENNISYEPEPPPDPYAFYDSADVTKVKQFDDIKKSVSFNKRAQENMRKQLLEMSDNTAPKDIMRVFKAVHADWRKFFDIEQQKIDELDAAERLRRYDFLFL